MLGFACNCFPFGPCVPVRCPSLPLSSTQAAAGLFTAPEPTPGSTQLQRPGRRGLQVQSLAPHLWAPLLQIIGTIPLMPNPGPSSQAAGSTQGLQVQPITPQLLTNAQGQIIATVIGNQILPVINTQGITLSPIKPGQQVKAPRPGGHGYLDTPPYHPSSVWSPSMKSNFLIIKYLISLILTYQHLETGK